MARQNKPLPDTCRALAAALAGEVINCGRGEQAEFLLAQRNGNNRCVVVVAWGDQAVEAMLLWLDAQKEAGLMRGEQPEP